MQLVSKPGDVDGVEYLSVHPDDVEYIERAFSKPVPIPYSPTNGRLRHRQIYVSEVVEEEIDDFGFDEGVFHMSLPEYHPFIESESPVERLRTEQKKNQVEAEKKNQVE